MKDVSATYDPDRCTEGTDTACSVTVGVSVEGEIEFPGDRDWYEASFVSGREYRVEMKGELSDATLTLYELTIGGIYDNNGALIPDTSDFPIYREFARVDYTATRTGVHYISLSSTGSGEEEYGTYRLEVTDVTTGEQQVVEPLTVQLTDTPKNHDGSAFSFRLEFSADVTITPEAMREHALDVSGAAVTQAVQVDGRADLWEITLEPSGTDAVSISLSPQGACTEAGTLCDGHGSRLTTLFSALVLYVGPPAETVGAAPLTAQFTSVPEDHGGDRYTTFQLELLFSEAVKVTNKRMRRRVLDVENGTLAELRRIDRRKDYWRMTVRPDDHRPVTVSLASADECGARHVVCSFEGKPLSQPVSVTVIGPPGLSVADAAVDEGPGATLDFVVTMDRAARRAVTVNYQSVDGTAVVEEDYEWANGELTFAAGETEKTVSVRVLDDAHDEGDETMTLRLSDPVGAWLADREAVGTIRNTDLMPQAWLARFGRTVADQVIDAVEGRVTSARSPGTELQVAGQSFGGAEATEEEMREAETRLERLSTWFRDAGDEDEDALGLETRAVTGRDILAGTSFALTEGTAESGFGGLWGRGTVTRFDGREDELTLEGEVESALLGADVSRGRWTAGLAVGHSRAEGGYASPQGDGAVESTLTGIYPYGRYDVDAGLSLWGVVGMGQGSLTLTPEGMDPIETDMALRMAAAAGLRSVLVDAPADGGFELAATSDAMAVETTSDKVRSGGSLAAAEAGVTRLRAGLEGRWRGIGSLEPSFEIGLRQDGGDAETGFGADIGAGLMWSEPARGIQAEVRARGLLTHEDSGFKERGLSGSFAWDPEPASDLGPSLTLSQTVGSSASGGMEALLRPDAARLFDAANDDGKDELRRRRFEARLGYGWSSFGGRYTTVPEVGIGLTEATREVSPRLASCRGEERGARVRCGRGGCAPGTRRRRGRARAPSGAGSRLASRGTAGEGGCLRDPFRGLAARRHQRRRRAGEPDRDPAEDDLVGPPGAGSAPGSAAPRGVRRAGGAQARTDAALVGAPLGSDPEVRLQARARAAGGCRSFSPTTVSMPRARLREDVEVRTPVRSEGNHAALDGLHLERTPGNVVGFREPAHRRSGVQCGFPCGCTDHSLGQGP